MVSDYRYDETLVTTRIQSLRYCPEIPLSRDQRHDDSPLSSRERLKIHYCARVTSVSLTFSSFCVVSFHYPPSTLVTKLARSQSYDRTTDFRGKISSRDQYDKSDSSRRIEAVKLALALSGFPPPIFTQHRKTIVC